MIAASVAERVADQAARELLRVAAHRPHLEARCDRAADIVVDHLSTLNLRPSAQRIRIAVRADKCRYMVRGSRGSVYVVDPGSWRCSCPDYHRRDAACKHALACWALYRCATIWLPSPDVSGEAYMSEKASVGDASEKDDVGEERRREAWRELWRTPEAFKERVDRLPDPYPAMTGRPMAECS